MKSKYAIRDAAITSFEVNGNFTADDSISIVHVTCSKHPGKVLELMCDCGDTICPTCVAVGHDGHKKTTLLEAADKNKAELQGASLVTRRADAVQAQARLNVEEFDRGLKGGHAWIELWEQEAIDRMQRHVRDYTTTTR